MMNTLAKRYDSCTGLSSDRWSVMAIINLCAKIRVLLYLNSEENY